jgi:hypothetical protein
MPAGAIDGVETDAPFVVVRRDRAGNILNHLTLDGGTYLRVDGQTISLK